MTRLANLPLALALLALAATAAQATAADGETGADEAIVERHLHDCEGEECGHQRHVRRVIVIDHGGELREIEAGDVRRLGHAGHHGWLGHGGGAFLGVATTELTPELRRHFGVPDEAGLLVARVVDDSAAARAGVQVGDVLTAVDGEALSSTHDLIRQIRRREPGSTVDLELWRDGLVQTASTTLDERPRRERQALVLDCGGEGDCPHLAAIHEFDCGGEGECRVEIDCDDDGCECTVNGEAAACEALPGFVEPGG